MKMMNENMVAIISDINRALGMIEGVSYGAEDSVSQCLVDAVQIIDNAMEELKKHG